MSQIFNANPTIFSATSSQTDTKKYEWLDINALKEAEESDEAEPIDRDEVFDLIRHIYDPEHPNTLEELAVVSAPQIDITNNRVLVEFTPTVPHCGMSTLIGTDLYIHVLGYNLPPRFKVDIKLKPGSHNSEHSVNKQLNDKERVAAALENKQLLDTVDQCLRDARPILV